MCGTAVAAAATAVSGIVAGNVAAAVIQTTVIVASRSFQSGPGAHQALKPSAQEPSARKRGRLQTTLDDPKLGQGRPHAPHIQHISPFGRRVLSSSMQVVLMSCTNTGRTASGG